MPVVEQYFGMILTFQEEGNLSWGGGDHQVSQHAGRVIITRSCHHLPLLSAGLEQLINIAPLARNTLDINMNYTQSSLTENNGTETIARHSAVQYEG